MAQSLHFKRILNTNKKLSYRKETARTPRGVEVYESGKQNYSSLEKLKAFRLTSSGINMGLCNIYVYLPSRQHKE